jgi:sugar-specific transcriptional regulator TrmB|tara:strand:+ start:45 stop:503 length:459 start_codon:yes stop_codon:yes gene_type:complete
MTKAATRKKQKEVAELKRKAKAKEKLTKSGPPSKKELVDKAANLMSKRETMRSSAFPSVNEKTRKQLKINQLESKATRDIRKMLNKRIGDIDMADLLTNVSDPLRKRQKLTRELKKEGAARQIPASMKKGGEVTSEYRGGGMVNLGNYKGQF